MDFILVSFAVLILYIWFETDAFPEWFALLRLKFIPAKGYFIFKKEFPTHPIQSFPDYLESKHNSFLTRLLSCPLCSGAWLNIIGIVVFYHCKWHLLGIDIIATWLAFFGLRRVIYKWNA